MENTLDGIKADAEDWWLGETEIETKQGEVQRPKKWTEHHLCMEWY